VKEELQTAAQTAQAMGRIASEPASLVVTLEKFAYRENYCETAAPHRSLTNAD
jgi:hypothetical protein